MPTKWLQERQDGSKKDREMPPRRASRGPPFGSVLDFKKVLRRIVKRFRGGLVFKALRLIYHSTLGSRVKNKKKEKKPGTPPGATPKAPVGSVLDLKTTTSQNCEAVPRRARSQGSQIVVSLNSRLENKKKKKPGTPSGAMPKAPASPFGSALDLKTTTSQNSEAVPRRARS